MRVAVTTFLLAMAVGMPAWSATEDESRWHDLRESLFGDRQIHEESGVVSLEAPYRAHDAALVPVTFEAAFPQTSERYVKSITLIVDENPLPMAGQFRFTEASGWAAISTRIRVNAYTHVRAVAETNDGQLHMAKRYVKASGGCSAPAGKDPEAALASLGKMKLRRFDPVLWGEPNNAQLLVSHPNHTGMQMDQVTRHYVLAYFIDSIEVRYGDQPVLAVESNFSLSENPAIRFHYVPDGPGELSVRVTDSDGAMFARAWSVPASVAKAPVGEEAAPVNPVQKERTALAALGAAVRRTAAPYREFGCGRAGHRTPSPRACQRDGSGQLPSSPPLCLAAQCHPVAQPP